MESGRISDSETILFRTDQILARHTGAVDRAAFGERLQQLSNVQLWRKQDIRRHRIGSRCDTREGEQATMLTSLMGRPVARIDCVCCSMARRTAALAAESAALMGRSSRSRCSALLGPKQGKMQWNGIRRGCIPLWVLPSACTIFYFLTQGGTLSSPPPPHTG